MTHMTRRAVTLMGLAAAGTTAACGNGFGGGNAAQIDARVQSTLGQLYAQYPSASQVAAKATGVLVMPLITEAGLGIGGGYGRGALLIDGATVDYYSAAKGNIGLQIGAQQYSHVLFFMTDDALLNFRRSPGWAAGADVEYAVPTEGGALATETTTALAPVIAFLFGQAGLRIGATLEGTKYTRIIP
ncbi:YSC84-related protein [Mesobacterium pallidum]|uniref:lipid-binding SYLF domain-containing protein n=1 Tax=Mesobacterium pallidum TaxID=2872037 RepID=UPI001EE1E139|nr:YSC84-related protein [Mesobacterium pallidum]